MTLDPVIKWAFFSLVVYKHLFAGGHYLIDMYLRAIVKTQLLDHEYYPIQNDYTYVVLIIQEFPRTSVYKSHYYIMCLKCRCIWDGPLCSSRFSSSQQY